jgi:hypothetical protein
VSSPGGSANWIYPSEKAQVYPLRLQQRSRVGRRAQKIAYFFG